jgi:hypothetical protein
MARRSFSCLAPLTSSAITTGGTTTSPPARASSNAGLGRPEKKSIQTEVSTTTLTRLTHVYFKLDLASQGHGLLVGAGTAQPLQTFNKSLGDPFTGDSHGISQNVLGEICSDPSHLFILIYIMTLVNTTGGQRNPRHPRLRFAYAITLRSAALNLFMSSCVPIVTRTWVGQAGQLRPM